MSIMVANNELVACLMAVLDTDVNQPEALAGKTLALTECITRLLIQRLNDDPVSARAIADSLTQRFLARIAEGGINRNDFLN
jgi:hypothetical protein